MTFNPHQTATRIPVILLLLVCSVSAQAADEEWTNIQLNQDTTTQLQNEEQIAINPTDPDNMVAVWRDFRLGYRQVGWAYTFDGGKTWTEGGLIPEPNYTYQSDPGITADNDGNFYAVVLSYTGPALLVPMGLFVLKSTDGGVTWGSPMAAIDGVVGAFEDKEFIACDRTSTLSEGNLYVTWTRFTTTTEIMAVRSVDSGASWSTPVRVSDGNDVQFPIPVVGQRGEVYIAWTSYETSSIMMDVSTDGGRSYGADREVISVRTPTTVLNGGIDAYSSPHMDADVTYGPYSGRLYIAFMDRRENNRDFDIWVISNDGKGLDWTPPVRINDDTPNNGSDQFHPWLTVDNKGIVTVVWLDRRHDPANRTYHCYMSQSTDGGVTWSPNVQISDEPSDPAYAYQSGFPGEDPAAVGEKTDDPTVPETSLSMAGLLGEYIGVVSWNGIATPIWTDIRNLNQDVFVGYSSRRDIVLEFTPRLAIAPNPIHSDQEIFLWSGTEGPGTLRIYDAMGREVHTMKNMPSTDGQLNFRWNGISRGSGIYFLRLSTPSGISQGSLIVVE